jgi:hypothetical protein
MTATKQDPQIQERRAMVIGKMIADRGRTADKTTPVAMSDVRTSTISEPDARQGSPVTMKKLKRILALSGTANVQRFLDVLDGADRQEIVTDPMLNRFLQVANRVAGDVPVDGGKQTSRLVDEIGALPMQVRPEILLLLASDAAVMLGATCLPGAFRVHLRRTVSELAARRGDPGR